MGRSLKKGPFVDQKLLGVAIIGISVFAAGHSRAADPLPSWNDTATRAAIVKFVDNVTTEGSPDFVPYACAVNSRACLPHKDVCKLAGLQELS